jgi:MFS family permease
MFDSTMMASSHPVITSYFNASNSASWLSTAFLLTSTSFQPLFGRVSDTIGRRPLYLAGLIFLAAMTGWCALAKSIGSFIAARAFCGLGAAGVLAMGRPNLCYLLISSLTGGRQYHDQRSGQYRSSRDIPGLH